MKHKNILHGFLQFTFLIINLLKISKSQSLFAQFGNGNNNAPQPQKQAPSINSALNNNNFRFAQNVFY
jgi:hypothetical protein